jgi:putative tricarboxylic transport membrane protein
LLLSRGNPLIFIQRPISAAMLALAALAIILASLPAIYKKREETFKE